MPFTTPLKTPSKHRKLRIGATLCTLLGVCFLALGVIGIYLPGVPTTGPLIFASFLLGRSHPQLQQSLLNAPLFKRYQPFIDGSVEITWLQRTWALACMWSMIGCSCWIMSLSNHTNRYGLPACLFGGLLGSFCIVLYRTGKTASSKPVTSVGG